jgi:hypothetical protein
MFVLVVLGEGFRQVIVILVILEAVLYTQRDIHPREQIAHWNSLAKKLSSLGSG